MRYLFLTLILANLFYFLWEYQKPAQSSVFENPPTVTGSQRLVLLAETREPEQAEELAAASPELDAQFDFPDIEITNNEEAQEAKQTDQAEGFAEEQTTPLVVQTSCHTIGPFKELNNTRRAEQRLKDLGLSSQRRSKTEPELFGYRVYLQPLADREAAIAEAKKLATQGIRDYFIINNEAEKNNAISLGLFRQKSGAIRRMAQVRNLGFKPDMEIRYRDQNIYWLDYEQTGEVVDQAIWLQLSEGLPVLQNLDRECG